MGRGYTVALSELHLAGHSLEMRAGELFRESKHHPPSVVTMIYQSQPHDLSCLEILNSNWAKPFFGHAGTGPNTEKIEDDIPK